MIKGRKNGSAWIGILILLIFITSLGLAIVVDSINTITQSKKSAQIISAQALCDAGIEKAIWKLNDNSGYQGEEYSLPTGDIDISVFGDFENKEVYVTAYIPERPPEGESAKTERRIRAKIIAESHETGGAFNYAIQAGTGGITLSPTALLDGNIYSAGPVTCQNNSNITGDVYISEDNPGSGIYPAIDGCAIGGNVEAYNILDSNIVGWGKYVNSNNNSSASGGFSQIDQAQLNLDVPFTNMGISELTIETWESWANEDGNPYVSDYVLSTGQSSILGPKKIEGDLILNSGSVLTLSGVVWVEGNIYLNTGATLNLDPSYGPNSGMLIADYPADRSNKGFIKVGSNVDINGSGNNDSYILILSGSNKSTISDPAIFAGNNSDSVVYYSNNGMIEVNNNAKLKALSGGGIHLSNGAQIIYDSGLASTNFSGGPGGSWKLKEWQVVY